jgi:hypothetical protein
MLSSDRLNTPNTPNWRLATDKFYDPIISLTPIQAHDHGAGVLNGSFSPGSVPNLQAHVPHLDDCHGPAFHAELGV